MNALAATLESVKTYYGKVLASTKDLQTSACCSVETLPPSIAAIASQVHEEVRGKFYGCGLVTPPALEGATVLDLGCGSGRDVYILSKLVGPSGRVIGVDMTKEQLEVARRHVDYHTKLYGYQEPNVSFLEGYIEDLESIGIASNTVDLVVSNCVVNLSPAKDRVMREVFRVLKPGGELYFSDVYCDRRLSAACQQDPVLLGECLGGAMYVEDFRRLLNDVGVKDFRAITKQPITIQSEEIRRKLGNAQFQSITYRAFKLEVEDKCEDYGEVAYYLGTVPGQPHSFMLDDHHLFETGKPMTVCTNTADMVMKTRYAPHFRVVGERSTHYGLFPCGPSPVAPNAAAAANGAACAPGGACC